MQDGHLYYQERVDYRPQTLHLGQQTSTASNGHFLGDPSGENGLGKGLGQDLSGVFRGVPAPSSIHASSHPPSAYQPAATSGGAYPSPYQQPTNGIPNYHNSGVAHGTTSPPRSGSLLGYQQASSTFDSGTTPMASAAFGTSAAKAAPISNPSINGQAPRVNTSAMPNVIAVQEEDESRFAPDGYYFKTSSTNEILPPLTATGNVVIVDDGNASSKLVRLSTYNIPTTEELAHSIKLPLALLMQPFNIAQSGEAQVPLVEHFGSKGPLRCSRCRAYINVFVRFVRSGRSFECNICSMVNDVPDEYYAQLDHSGRRMDLNLRPELTHGAVDFVASEEYYSQNRPSSPYILFAVDCSRSAIQNGSFHTALTTLRKIIGDHAQNEYQVYQKMSLVTFDKSIYMYDLRADDPQVLVLPDVNDPFLPLCEGLFWNPAEVWSRVTNLLDRLPDMFMETRIVDSCFGAVSTFAIEALKSHGGRVTIFSSSLPTIGVGLLRNRDNATSVAPDKINPLLLPQIDFYEKLGKDACFAGVSFVLVLCASSSVDLSTIGKLSSCTGGRVFHYPKFNPELRGQELMLNVISYLTKPFVYDSIIRVRVSSNLQIGEYIGALATPNQIDYHAAVLDCDQTFCITFFHDGRLAEMENITFQCAVLHTTSTGQRRIRVLNIMARATSQLANIYRMADLDTILQFSIKRIIAHIPLTPLPTLVQHFYLKAAQSLASYRKNCAANMPSGQLVLPESLKLLPLYCLTISKSPAFSSELSNVDSRMAELFDLFTMSMSTMNTRLYPRLYPLHRLLELSESELPHPIRLSREFIEPHGIYLLCDGRRLVIWIGFSTDPEVLSKIFGVATPVNISRNDELPELNNLLSWRVRSFISVLRNQYPNSFLSLQVVRQGVDATEVEWNAMMVEDGHSSYGLSYVDFLCRLHNQINHELSSSSLAERTALLSFLQ